VIGEEVNATIGGGITPLHMAAALNSKETVSLLLCKGADPNACTSGGFTPLHWAAGRDAADAAGLLLAAGAALSPETYNGITPLHWAASKNATNVVKLLITRGTDISAATESGLTPLHWAVMKDAVDAAVFLAFKDISKQMDQELEEGKLLEEESPEEEEGAEEESETPMALRAPALPRPAFGKALIVPIGFGEELEFVWIDSMKLWAGKYEVSNGQFRRFKPKHDSLFREEFSLDGPGQPAVYMSWSEANAFCNWLTRNYADRIPLGCGFRLPSGREWTACARCGDKRRYPWGNKWPPAYGNFSDFAARKRLSSWQGIRHYDDGHPVTCAVTESGVNEWGIYGLAGNVWEWCDDWFDTSRQYKVRRGGCWDFDDKKSLRIDARGFDRPDAHYDTVGFRVVVSKQQD